MRRTFLGSAIVLALAGAALTAAPSAFADKAPVAATANKVTTQLPLSVRPSHYDVEVTPHAESLTFDGKVTITVDVLEPTSSITLNAIDMSFSKVSLTPASGKALADPKVAVDAEKQTATFTFAKPLAKGSYKLSMDYTGKIGTQANGLFAIDYDTKAGKKRALYTQFENSDARRFIPSWDEPNYKATFNLVANVPADQMAVSNMPIAKKEDAGKGLEKVTFQPSPKMSTYLLFFGVGDFERATKMAGKTEVGVITQKGMLSQADFALDSAKIILDEYNDYFGTPFPLPKLDNIASPGRSQFFGAMENWGAIYTFEYILLLDPTISTQSDKQAVFSVQAHEMAHQWFGDLVTMRWWDDLWLNEGFASWMEGRTTAKLHPEWNTKLEEVGVREGAMGRDAIATTHPIVQHIETVEQASQAFDAITYSKGQAVIGMLEGYVGADGWRDGVRLYMKQHAYGNTVSDDLWKAVETASKKPVTTIAHDFTLQPGIPMIKVESATCNAGKTTIKLSQGEFTRDRPNKTALKWHVPVIAQTVGGEPARTVVDGTATMELAGCGPVLVNAGQSGYYRTLYGTEQFDALKGSFAKLQPIDQLGVLGDSWALGMAGLQSSSSFLDLVQATPADADPQIWGDIAGDLTALDGYYDGDAARQGAFRKFAVAKLKPVFAKVGWEEKAGEADPVKVLRNQLIGVLGTLGDQDVIKEARRRYAASEKDSKALPGAIRRVTLAVVARNADAATWDKLHAAAKAEKTPMVKDQLYTLLSVAQDKALAQRALDLALTDEPGATNSAGMIGAVSGRHPEMAFDFAVAHKAQVDKLVDSTSSSRYYPALGGRSLNPAMVGKLKAFADKYIAEGSRRDTETAIANIEYRVKVRDDRMPAIDAWLKQHGA
ncbi:MULTISPECIES: M1 family metallopeptidase [Dyella]|uniref:Aminopeptidase n=2 Tax=Dyella TaxID=231454 RepID=A0A4R0YY69_9GAMM|nr:MULTISPECIES: M1 family metallopeptidase [Dyella]TBR38838.1 M1 family peptidase [Dyella terrae]TCI13571.1 M1 family peptidase [Dyella soli]